MSSNPGREGGLSFFVEGKLDLKRCLVGQRDSKVQRWTRG
jgi:hypothetical protein